MFSLVWHATVMSQVSVIIKSPSGRQYWVLQSRQVKRTLQGSINELVS